MSRHYMSVSNAASVYSELHLSKLAIQSAEAHSLNGLQTLAGCSPNHAVIPKGNWIMYWLHMWVAMRQ